MRLINVDTLELEEFFDESIPPYAILSHTWGQEEVSFQDLCWLHDHEKNRTRTVYTSLQALASHSRIGQNTIDKAAAIRQRAGFGKIIQSARLAKAENLHYVWVDTCCIDKTSSAELSEAINSMFGWYKRSDMCLAFLSDVDLRGKGQGGVRFQDSRWFTRGWTLQELLAPEWIWFYDKGWNEINILHSLIPQIAVITDIPEYAFGGHRRFDNYSLANIMSWASKRRTSRKEDMAYCLMGLFKINMPLLYGEGEKAFVRLQQEIIKEHTGQSLFAWGYNESVLIHGSIFAPSPALMGGGDMRENALSHIAPFNLSNRGLEISLDIFQVPKAGLSSIYYALWDVSFTRVKDQGHERAPGLCFPLFPAFDDEGDLKDSQHMARCLSGPLMIAKEHIPEEKIRRRILITKGDALYWRPKLPCIQLKMDMGSLYQFLPSARLVEIFPPALRMRMDRLGRVADFWFSHGSHREVFVFRFLCFNDLGEEIMRGNKSLQLAVIIGLRRPPEKDKYWDIMVEAAAVEWMDSSRVIQDKERRQMGVKRVAATEGMGEHDNGTASFCSLADAAFARVPLLDAKKWIRKRTPFHVDGAPLRVKGSYENRRINGEQSEHVSVLFHQG